VCDVGSFIQRRVLRAQKEIRASIVVGAVVISHWFLDAIVHRPDLPLLPGGEARVGLGLWNSVTATLLLEGAMFCAALIFYLRGSKALDRAGTWGLWGIVAFLLAAYAGATFGPPPPSIAPSHGSDSPAGW
jgi:hypothetical protein